MWIRFTELDLDLAKAEWSSWVQISKNQSNFWKSFLDENNNAFYEKSNKTLPLLIQNLQGFFHNYCENARSLMLNSIRPLNHLSPFIDAENQTSKFGFGFHVTMVSGQVLIKKKPI